MAHGAGGRLRLFVSHKQPVLRAFPSRAGAQGHRPAIAGPQPTVSRGGRAPSPFPLAQPTAGPGGPITSLCGSEWEQHGCTRCRCKSSIRPGGHQIQAVAGCPWLWSTSPVMPHAGGQSPGAAAGVSTSPTLQLCGEGRRCYTKCITQLSAQIYPASLEGPRGQAP